MKKTLLFAKIGCAVTIFIVLYAAISIPETCRLVGEVMELEIEFVAIAQKPAKVITAGIKGKSQPSYLLLYDGELDKIIQKRDRLVKKNNAWFWGAWTVSAEKLPDRPLFIKAKTTSLVFKPWLPA